MVVQDLDLSSSDGLNLGLYGHLSNTFQSIGKGFELCLKKDLPLKEFESLFSPRKNVKKLFILRVVIFRDRQGKNMLHTFRGRCV